MKHEKLTFIKILIHCMKQSRKLISKGPKNAVTFNNASDYRANGLRLA